MRVSNVLVLSVLSLIAMGSFLTIPEASHGIRATGSLLPVSHEIVVRDVLPLAIDGKQRS